MKKFFRMFIPDVERALLIRFVISIFAILQKGTSSRGICAVDG